jgi:hypothetical protein
MKESAEREDRGEGTLTESYEEPAIPLRAPLVRRQNHDAGQVEDVRRLFLLAEVADEL